MIRQSAKSFAYVLVSLPAGVFGFAWTVVSAVLCAVGSVTALGGPLFLGTTAVHRRIAAAERRRVAWVRGSPIASPYLPITGSALRDRVRQVAAQPATWRDMAWLIVLFPVGLAGAVVGVVAVAVSVGALLAPAWAWAVPEPTAPHVMQLAMSTLPGRLLQCVLGVLLVPVAGWLVRTLAAGQRLVAGKLLAPGEHGRLVRRAEELAATRARVVDAQAAELRRIERDLHDGAQARIVAAGMTLALAERRARTGEPIGEQVRAARHQLDDALEDLRRLVRGIHPPILTDRGLPDALSALVADAPIPVRLRVTVPARSGPALESAAYFLVAEGITNAAKHSGATGMDVTLERRGDVLTVEVRDNGQGAADLGGSGIDGLRRRVEALDGMLMLTSPPGGPTVLRAEFPCAS